MPLTIYIVFFFSFMDIMFRNNVRKWMWRLEVRRNWPLLCASRASSFVRLSVCRLDPWLLILFLYISLRLGGLKENMIRAQDWGDEL
jgi:hypothetical protein